MYCSIKGYGIGDDGRFEIGEYGRAERVLAGLKHYTGTVLHITITFHD